MVTQIKHPSTAFTGTDHLGVAFINGVAYTASPSVIARYRELGYGIGGNAPTAVDSRTVVPERRNAVPGQRREINGYVEIYDQIGLDRRNTPLFGWRREVVAPAGPLRDAATDPRAADYLPPKNAGKADPHSPDVVSPQVDGRYA